MFPISNFGFQYPIHVSNFKWCFQTTMFPMYVSNIYRALVTGVDVVDRCGRGWWQNFARGFTLMLVTLSLWIIGYQLLSPTFFAIIDMSVTNSDSLSDYLVWFGCTRRLFQVMLCVWLGGRKKLYWISHSKDSLTHCLKIDWIYFSKESIFHVLKCQTSSN